MPRSKSSEGDKEDKVLVADATIPASDEAKSQTNGAAMDDPGQPDVTSEEKEVRAAQSEPKESLDVAQQPTDSSEIPSRYSAMLAQNRTRSPSAIKIEVQAKEKNAAKRS